ncbi:acetate--CoA ligase [uncultured Agrococcus sp.]|uniref:acetate--CoA ligase n=1 Tax=uncultured Agrococcus sp. TaxID=382258 RepID=UPI0025CF34CE|nr:acetate--CoA ligase [uncultured Agrococcus sp.]
MNESIDSLMNEVRRFPPSEEFRAESVVDASIYDAAEADRLQFWADRARELHWHEEFTQVLDWQPPHAKWFYDGKINVAYNCLDRHVEAGNGDRVAFHWEGEPGDQRKITYAEMTAEVKRLANVMLGLGIRKGDRVAIYMPMIPESVAAMLACARIGATHTTVFGGFSPQNLRMRVDDADAKLVITVDGFNRKGKVFALKPTVDTALEAEGHNVENVLVVRRGENEIDWNAGRDIWYHEAMADAEPEHVAEGMEAEHPLFILYTSGTTGNPKGILHTSAGYLTQAAYTHRIVFDIKPERDVFWCTADVGWVTGHSYVVYGPMANGVTQVMSEGTFDTPTPHRPWQMIERYGVTVFYTAPTAIRTFMKIGREYPQESDLSSLRVLGTVGEPINPEAWMWYRDVIGGGKTPVVDTWWQTETGAIMISPLAGVTELTPGSAEHVIPGIEIGILNEKGEPVPQGQGGLLTITSPWPGMLRTIWGDDKRYRETYWEKFGDKYFAGDGARIDDNGDIWLLGRVDDVMNVSGHRLSTAEIESSLVAHEATAEAAVVGASDATTGQAVVAFVILKSRFEQTKSVEEAEAILRKHVADDIGAIARPRQVFIVPDLPKTRSGKIMRRLLRDLAEGREVGDTTTLADGSVVKAIQEQMR